MIEEQLKTLIDAQQETNRLLGVVITQLAAITPTSEFKQVSEPTPVEKPKSRKAKKEPTPEPEAAPEPETKVVLKDIVKLCADGKVTRDNVQTLLTKYNAKKLPEIDEDKVPEFYRELLKLSEEQKEAA